MLSLISETIVLLMMAIFIQFRIYKLIPQSVILDKWLEYLKIGNVFNMIFLILAIPIMSIGFFDFSQICSLIIIVLYSIIEILSTFVI